MNHSINDRLIIYTGNGKLNVLVYICNSSNRTSLKVVKTSYIILGKKDSSGTGCSRTSFKTCPRVFSCWKPRRLAIWGGVGDDVNCKNKIHKKKSI